MKKVLMPIAILLVLVLIGIYVAKQKERIPAEEPAKAKEPGTKPVCYINFVMKASSDLNGDGQPEQIALTEITDTYDFRLVINDVSVAGQFEDGEADGLIIIDVDTSDPYKEVAVHTPGPSDDDVYIIYWFDGESIRLMGKLMRWPEFPGNGIVYVDDWMGFWKKKDKYVLDRENRTLKLIPQELYNVDVEGSVLTSFPICQNRAGSKILADLAAGSKITILACDPSNPDYDEQWYLIKTETGLLGWAKLKTFRENVEGLFWAD